ncbi:MAG: RagB/SusD family nutrient uptake outer membrane protein [Chitinophagaceae bacterium]|nr:MAG: RagB/SusD family nutrient uptake outer membrane protein [Chitinophagaceae bacterium]
MKKILIYISFTGLLGLTACDKQLEQLNPQAIDASLAFGTSEKVKQNLIGAYASFGTGSLFGGDVLWMSELLASNGELTWAGTFPEPRQIWGKSILVNNSYVRATYQNAYTTIAALNNILFYLDVVDAADRPAVEGETKFLRGMLYFELIKFFGEKSYSAGNPASLKGVPLVLDPRPTTPTSSDNQVPRSTVEAVYSQIIADLTDAETMLPEENGFYANKPAASLALARVYLQMLNYTAARDAAHRCITVAEDNGFSLADNFEDEFNTDANTPEDIFAMQVNTQTGTNNNQLYYSTPTFGARDGDIQINEAHLDLYSASDARGDFFFTEGGSVFTNKWRDQYMNVKVMRLSEAYLIRAECNVRLGTSVGQSVADDLDETRSRAGLSYLAAPTLADVLLERRLELAFEGQAFADAKRLQLVVDGLPYDSPKMVFPIPQRETNIYDIEQNPGYF